MFVEGRQERNNIHMSSFIQSLAKMNYVEINFSWDVTYGSGLERSSPSAHLEWTLVSHAFCRTTGKQKQKTKKNTNIDYLFCVKSLLGLIANLYKHTQSQWPGTTLWPSCLLIPKPSIHGGWVLFCGVIQGPFHLVSPPTLRSPVSSISLSAYTWDRREREMGKKHKREF